MPTQKTSLTIWKITMIKFALFISLFLCSFAILHSLLPKNSTYECIQVNGNNNHVVLQCTPILRVKSNTSLINN